MDKVSDLVLSIDLRLKKHKLSKAWLCDQLQREGEEDITVNGLYNITCGRAHADRIKSVVAKCHKVIDNYEKRMQI